MKWGKLWRSAAAWSALLIQVFPICLTVLYSLDAPAAVERYLRGVHGVVGCAFSPLKLFPERASLLQYRALLLEQVDFLRYFLNSVGYVLAISVGQLATSSAAAFALAFLRSRAANFLTKFYVLLMLLPFQVTMVPNFMLLRWMNLLDSCWALILPALFAPFSVFLLRQYWVTIPVSTFEAARMDGANWVRAYLSIALPVGRPALITAFMLCAGEAWNLIEQPLVLLRSPRLFPLSLALLRPEFQGGVQFAAATLFLLPMLITYLFLHADVELNFSVSDFK